MAPLRVRDMMTASPFTIGASQSLEEADRLMRRHHVRHLPVLAENGALVGVLGRHDLEWLAAASELAPACITAQKGVRGLLVTVGPDVSMVELTRLMGEQHADSAVVTEGGRVVGVITITDLLRCLTDVLRQDERAQTP